MQFIEFSFGERKPSTYAGPVNVASEEEVTIDKVIEALGNFSALTVSKIDQMTYKYVSDDLIMEYNFKYKDATWQPQWYTLDY